MTTKEFEELKRLNRPLCYRCEHRARFHETGHGPRMECQNATTASCGCYMYRPVEPLILRAAESEKQIGVKRPLGGPGMIAARAHGRKAEEADGLLMVGVPVGKKGEITMVYATRGSLDKKLLKSIDSRQKKEQAMRVKWEKKMAKMNREVL